MQNVYKGDKLFKAIRKDNGKEVQGAYLEHINRQICVLGDYLKPEDITHYIIFGGFADWNMPIPVQMVEVIPETVVQYINATKSQFPDLVVGKSMEERARTLQRVVESAKKFAHDVAFNRGKITYVNSSQNLSRSLFYIKN